MTASPHDNDASPNVDGVEAVFWHIDDIDWTEVQRQQNADGSVSVVREKWPIIRPGFLSAHVHQKRCAHVGFESYRLFPLYALPLNLIVDYL